jgi:phosphate transport system permease protein
MNESQETTKTHRKPLSHRSNRARRGKDRLFVIICIMAAASSVLVLGALLISVTVRGLPHLDWQFLSGVPSRDAKEAGIWPATAGTLAICLVCALTAIPIGVGTAVLLEEYKPRRPWLKRLHGFVQLNITNLAGVPSIVYGLLGLTAFSFMFGLFGDPRNPRAEIGIAYYDQYLTPAGNAVLARAASPDAPLRPAGEASRFVDVEYHPIDVTVIDGESFAPQMQQLEADLEVFGDAMQKRIEELQTVDRASVQQTIERTWAEAGLMADVESLAPQLADELLAAQAASGREARRIVRRAVRNIERSEATARFPAVLSADAMPSRITKQQPWYIRLPFGRSILAGGLTLMLVILPIVIIASQEAIRAVPKSLRQASLAMGATQWQTTWKVTLPSAVPGIMTGVILAMSRAIGEAAPILIIAGIVYITFTPQNLMDDFTAMPLQVYNWASRPQKEFYDIAAAGIILLLLVLLVFNGLAVYIRHRSQKAGRV